MSIEFWWTVVSTAAMLAFNVGVIYQVIKGMRKELGGKPTESRVIEIIDQRFKDNFTQRVENLEKIGKEDHEYKKKLAMELLKENESNHLALQRIELNLINVCKKIGVDYIK